MTPKPATRINAPCEELPKDIQQPIISINACIGQGRKFPETTMMVGEDLLIT